MEAGSCPMWSFVGQAGAESHLQASSGALIDIQGMKRQAHKGAFAGGFYGPGTEVTHITLGHSPSAGT